MDNQPHRAAGRCFIGPHAHQTRRRIAEKTHKFSDADFARCSLELDERIIASERNARTVQGFSHEKRTCGSGRASESNEIVAAQSLTSLRDSRSRQIRLRSVEQETNLSDL